MQTDTCTSSLSASLPPPPPSHVHPSQHCSCRSADGEYLCPPRRRRSTRVHTFVYAHATASHVLAISRFRVTSFITEEKRCKSPGKSDVMSSPSMSGYGIMNFLYGPPLRREFPRDILSMFELNEKKRGSTLKKISGRKWNEKRTFWLLNLLEF